MPSEPLLPALEDAAPLYRLQAPPPDPTDDSRLSSVAAADPADTATTPHGDESETDAPAWVLSGLSQVPPDLAGGSPAAVPPITHPYPRPFIPAGSLAAPLGPHRTSSASSAAPPPESGAALSTATTLESPLAAPAPQSSLEDAPALVPELDVLLRDTLMSPRRREGSAPLFAARRESSSTHAAPPLLARLEPESGQSAPALVPALDALEFDPPTDGPKPRRSPPNLIPPSGSIRISTGLGGAAGPRRDRLGRPGAIDSPGPKDSSSASPAAAQPGAPAVHDLPTLLPVGLAATEPGGIHAVPTPGLHGSLAVPVPSIPPIRVLGRSRHPWLGIGVALALLGFIVVRLIWYANRDVEPQAEQAGDRSRSDSPSPADSAPTPPDGQAIPPGPDPAPAPAAPRLTCPEGPVDDPAIGLLVVPSTPVAGEPLRLLAATLAEDVALSLHLAGGDAVLESRARMGLPSAAIAGWTPAAAGEYTVAIASAGVVRACRSLRVESAPPERPQFSEPGRVWPVERAWTGAEEALYSAWLRELFAGEPGEASTVTRFDHLTTDPARNLLHDALRLGEDGVDVPGALHLRPDGADLPYSLRAYWAWKRRLPFAYRPCTPVQAGQPPRCGDPRTNLDPGRGYTGKATELARVQRFFHRDLIPGVHAGNVRTAHGDSASDLYPVRLDRRALRPGAVYAEPYGQTVVVVDLLAAGDGQPGAVWTIIGRPDGSLHRRRFRESELLWNPDPALGGNGFKRFRPVVRRDGGGLAQLDDAAIGGSPDLGDIWVGHADVAARTFHDAVTALVEPPPWDAARLQRDAVEVLAELARARVEPVARGAQHARSRRRPIDMPVGHPQLDATGAWATYATPGRDLRLLHALHVVRRVAARVRERPDLFFTDGDAEAAARALELEREHLLGDPDAAITYTRSDGSPWTLTLRDLLDRSDALERAYNPNDCPELRWGAPAGSDELATCSFRAPPDQHARMEAHRAWFRERRPPARGDEAP